MDYYVYVHRKKTTGEVFYVGKGRGRRAWQWSDRSSYWKRVAEKYGYTVEIYLSNIQEWYAFEVEKNLIAYYGREDSDEGTLVNHTDGGEGLSGYIYSEERLQLIREQRKGELHPNYKSELLYFYNLDTGTIVSDTRYGFLKSFPGVSVRALVSGSQRSSKRWVILDLTDEDEIRALTEGIFKGENNANYDNKVYKVLNVKTLQEFEGTRSEFVRKFNFKLDPLFGEINHKPCLKGWCLSDNFNKVMSLRQQRMHTFESDRDGRFMGTHRDFIKKYGYNVENLFRKKNPAKISKGWKLIH